MEKQIIKQLLKAWENQNKTVTELFGKFEETYYQKEVAEGRNRAIYLLGHLIGMNDGLFPMFGLGNRLFPELEPVFINNPDKAIADIPSLGELKEKWTILNERLAEQFNKMTPEQWLERHTKVSEADFALDPMRNKLNVLIGRINHQSYHLGQLASVNPVLAYTHQTAPTKYVTANGVRLAYRRWGKRGGVPLVFFMHFTGTMDHWDPLIIDGLAKEREVILFNNAGISSSEGEVPESIDGMAAYGIAFIEALGLKQVDLLGFSLGGLVAQQVTLDRPDLVRRLVLAGTGPKAGVAMATLTPEAQQIFGRTYDVPEELWLGVFFTPSEKSQAAGRAFLKRFLARQEQRDPEVNEKVAPAQVAALAKWGAESKEPYKYLESIQQPTLVVNGSNDVIIYTVNSFILQQHLPDAELILYPDGNHGSQYQYPELFVEDVNQFLNSKK